MKVLIFLVGCIAATHAGVVPYPVGTTIIRSPVFDNKAIIHANAIPGSFAYSAFPGHHLPIAPVGLPYGYSLVQPSLYGPNYLPGGGIFGPGPVFQLVPAVGEPAKPAGDADKPVEEGKPEEPKPEEEKPSDVENVDEPAQEAPSDESPAAEEPAENPQSDDSVSVDSA